MAEVNLENIEAVEKVKSFWEKSGKMITYGGMVVLWMAPTLPEC